MYCGNHFMTHVGQIIVLFYLTILLYVKYISRKLEGKNKVIIDKETNSKKIKTKVHFKNDSMRKKTRKQNEKHQTQ